MMPKDWTIATDAEKLRLIAEWMDVKDAQSGNPNHEVQDDLRRMAREMEGN